MVASGKTKDKFLNACMRNIWLVTAIFDIDLHIKHIEGAKNITADHLSRIYSKMDIPPVTLDALHSTYTWKVVPIQFFNLNLHIGLPVRTQILKVYCHLHERECSRLTDQPQLRLTILTS